MDQVLCLCDRIMKIIICSFVYFLYMGNLVEQLVAYFT